MEESDLRLGNWLEVPEKIRKLVFETCHELDFPRFAQVSQIANDGIVNLLDGKGDELDFDLIDLQPILLTEEWLNKFGFSDKEYKKGWIGIDIRFTDFVLSKPQTEIKHSDCYCFNYQCGRLVMYRELKYVHNLQNFFHSITGEKLTLKK